MRSVLAIGAHPDDIEMGCGGALASHRAAGDAVTMLVLTGGQSGSGDVALRRAEQERAARVLDSVLIWAGLVDCALTADQATISMIENVMSTVGADIVYVHSPDDSHQDHRAATAATLSAARFGCSILHYRSPSTLHFHPTVFVEISEFLDRKLEALDHHRSQVDHSSMVDPDAIRASARHFGAQARVRYAEAFAPARFVWDLHPVSLPPETDSRAGAGTGIGAGEQRAGYPPVIRPRAR